MTTSEGGSAAVMDRKAAKELVHLQGWLERVDDIVQRGKDTYLSDDLLQEAGHSLVHGRRRRRTTFEGRREDRGSPLPGGRRSGTPH